MKRISKRFLIDCFSFFVINPYQNMKRGNWHWLGSSNIHVQISFKSIMTMIKNRSQKFTHMTVRQKGTQKPWGDLVGTKTHKLSKNVYFFHKLGPRRHECVINCGIWHKRKTFLRCVVCVRHMKREFPDNIIEQTHVNIQ